MLLTPDQFHRNPSQLNSLFQLVPKPVRSSSKGKRKISTATNQNRSRTSPMPGLFQECIGKNLDNPKLSLRNSYNNLMEQSKSRITISKLGNERSSSQQSKAGTIDGRKHPEPQIFHLYKPQILHISPRSKIRIYTTINLTQNLPKKIPRKNPSLLMKTYCKPSIQGQKSPDDSALIVKDPVEYVKPAMTFGEKLWRLNEVSIFNMLK
ncbi:hypothetical protein SteCoe_3682 [Stentor coeruleus]|uniref:Uncharacterized protein n=1 Tax=Stentor coeruleus TaxID=5963 RepID=A0A1R2CWG8_9CILI|nr:hypothetical protein SteCoe_3682 [Stentor coeruleus]